MTTDPTTLTPEHPDSCGQPMELSGYRIYRCELPAGHPLPHREGETIWQPADRTTPTPEEVAAWDAEADEQERMIWELCIQRPAKPAVSMATDHTTSPLAAAALDAIEARADTALGWVQRGTEDGWLPLSVREHFGADMRALTAEVRRARSAAAIAQDWEQHGSREWDPAIIQGLIDNLDGLDDERRRLGDRCRSATGDHLRALVAEVRQLSDTLNRTRQQLRDEAARLMLSPAHPPVAADTAWWLRRLAECPVCSGPSRETAGLVCQACGKDWGAKEETTNA